jgi:hypothetical protein
VTKCTHRQKDLAPLAGWQAGRPSEVRERESIDLGKGAIRAAVSVTCESLAVKFEVHHASSALKLPSAAPALDIIYMREGGGVAEMLVTIDTQGYVTRRYLLLKSSKGAARARRRRS